MFHTGHPFNFMRPSAPREVDKQHFYDLLKIPKTASANEIKKAYRNLAFVHHPDKGGDPEKFKEITKAYEVLSDPDKKAIYDEQGEAGLDGTADSGSVSSIFDLFMKGNSRSNKKSKGENIVSTVKVTLDQVYNGCRRKLAVNRDIICTKCTGLGGPDGSVVTCQSCNGKGIQIIRRKMGPVFHEVQMPCTDCKATGKIIRDLCKMCNGSGLTKDRKIFQVSIERGMKHKEKVVFYGEADQRPNEIPGDVVLTLEVEDHPVFERKGNDLYITRQITLVEALTGFKFKFVHLDERELLIKNRQGEIVTPNSVKGVKDEGMPIRQNPHVRGHLFIKFEVIFPDNDSLSEAAIKTLTEVLPAPPKLLVDLESSTLEHNFVTDLQPSTDDGPRAQREAYEQDQSDDEEPSPEVQCRQQ